LKPLQLGELVEHSARGRGKILALDHQNADVSFPSKGSTVRGSTVKVRLTMLARSDVQDDPPASCGGRRRPILPTPSLLT